MGKNDFELNQVIAYTFRSPEVLIGEQLAYEDHQIEIFDPELALIGKIDKLPVLRSLQIMLEAVPDILGNLIGDTTNEELKWLLQLFNDDDYQDPENAGVFVWGGKQSNALGVASLHAAKFSSATGESAIVQPNHFSMQYQGGIPLKPKLTFRNELGFAAVVAASSYPIGCVGHGKIFLEVDWRPVTDKEFTDYLKEYIFVQE